MMEMIHGAIQKNVKYFRMQFLVTFSSTEHARTNYKPKHKTEKKLKKNEQKKPPNRIEHLNGSVFEI